MMMKAAKDLKKQHPKPVGAPKQDSLGQKCEWNFEKGRWEADPKKQPKGWVVNPKDPTKYVDPNAPPTVTRAASPMDSSNTPPGKERAWAESKGNHARNYTGWAMPGRPGMHHHQPVVATAVMAMPQQAQPRKGSTRGWID